MQDTRGDGGSPEFPRPPHRCGGGRGSEAAHGSLLVAGGIDLASVKAAMGHSRITTTERYLHARPAGELAERFTRALGWVALAPGLSRAG